MASGAVGSVTFSTELDNKELEKDLDSLKKKIQTLEDGDAVKSKKLEQMQKDADALIIKLDDAKHSLDQLKNSDAPSSSAIKEQTEEVRLLQAEWNKSQTSIERMTASLSDSAAKTDLLKERAGEVSLQLIEASKNSNYMGEAINRAEAYMDKFTRRIQQLAYRALVFTLISKALRSLRDWMGRVIKTNDEATKAMARLKGALLTLAQPLVGVVIPAFIALVNVITRALALLAEFVSFIFGTTASESADAAKALNEQADGYGAAGAAAKKASKQLAAFDEINQLSNDESSGGGAGSSGAEITPDFSAFDVDAYKDKISELELFLGGALLALGAILTFSGVNIPLGLGLMMAGAATLVSAAKENWGALTPEIQNAVMGILVGVALLALAIGVVLLFTGHVGSGLGMIMISALSYWGATELGYSWGGITPEVQGAVAGLLAILIPAALVFGAVFLFSGNIALGLGLIAAAAAVTWGASAVGISWNSIPPAVQEEITALVGILLGAMFVIGVIILLAVNIPLGLGLMLGSAAAFFGASAIGVNWASVPTPVARAIAEILSIVGLAAMAIGAVFLFSGNIPLGLGLIAVGALSFFGAQKARENWGLIPSEVDGGIRKVLTVIAGAALAIGVILILSGAGLPLGLALIGMSAAAFFGLSGVSSGENWGKMQKDVGDSLDGIKSEIGVRKSGIRKESEGIGESLTDGTASAINAGAKDVEKSLVGALEGGVTAGNKAMEINSPSGVTTRQGEAMVDGWANTFATGATILGEKTLAVMDAITNSVRGAHPSVVDTFKFMFNDILGASQTFMNNYLSSLRSMLQQSADMMMALPNAPKISIPNYSMINIPRLATGAVIPPNREFMAVLGDQKSGMNIEAPADLIRSIVREEISAAGALGGGDVNATLELDGVQFGQLVFKYNNQESRRIGVQFAEA